MFRDRPQHFVDTPACRQSGSSPRKMNSIAKPSQRPRSTRSRSPDLSAKRKFVQRHGNVRVNLAKFPVFDFSECPLSNRKKVRAVLRYLFFPRSRNVVSHPLKSRQVEAFQIFRRRRRRCRLGRQCPRNSFAPGAQHPALRNSPFLLRLFPLNARLITSPPTPHECTPFSYQIQIIQGTAELFLPLFRHMGV
jgi:hypothetical protein